MASTSSSAFPSSAPAFSALLAQNDCDNVDYASAVASTTALPDRCGTPDLALLKNLVEGLSALDATPGAFAGCGTNRSSACGDQPAAYIPVPPAPIGLPTTHFPSFSALLKSAGTTPLGGSGDVASGSAPQQPLSAITPFAHSNVDTAKDFAPFLHVFAPPQPSDDAIYFAFPEDDEEMPRYAGVNDASVPPLRDMSALSPVAPLPVDLKVSPVLVDFVNSAAAGRALTKTPANTPVAPSPAYNKISPTGGEAVKGKRQRASAFPPRIAHGDSVGSGSGSSSDSDPEWTGSSSSKTTSRGHGSRPVKKQATKDNGAKKFLEDRGSWASTAASKLLKELYEASACTRSHLPVATELTAYGTNAKPVLRKWAMACIHQHIYTRVVNRQTRYFVEIPAASVGRVAAQPDDGFDTKKAAKEFLVYSVLGLTSAEVPSIAENAFIIERAYAILSRVHSLDPKAFRVSVPNPAMV